MAEPAGSASGRQLRVSVVIPVYNSEAIVAETVARTLAALERLPWTLEIILVNDGSSDRSWSVVEGIASTDKRVVAINLLRNFGQHNANLCGIRHATGDYLVTIDDDLQNPPEEIEGLVNFAVDGHHDVVFGRFRSKKASLIRRLGSRVINHINISIFGKPPGLTVSNFRVLDRSVYERIAGSSTAFPYITGQSLLHSRDPANLDVEHHPRQSGPSGYSPIRLLALVTRILFSYSVAPLRLVGLLGLVAAIGASALGVGAAVRAFVLGHSVPGWTSTIALIAGLNGVLILMMAMIGEYQIRVLQQVTASQPYQVSAIVDHRE